MTEPGDDIGAGGDIDLRPLPAVAVVIGYVIPYRRERIGDPRTRLPFAFNSAAGKWLVAKYSVGEFLLIRSTMTLILLLPLIWRAGWHVFAHAPRPGLQLLRVVLSSLEIAMFFWAVG